MLHKLLLATSAVLLPMAPEAPRQFGLSRERNFVALAPRQIGFVRRRGQGTPVPLFWKYFKIYKNTRFSYILNYI